MVLPLVTIAATSAYFLASVVMFSFHGICQRGVQLAIEVGARKIMLEAHNQGVMHALKLKELDRSRWWPLIEEIKKLLGLLDDFGVLWARRSANEASPNLAREDYLNKICKTWFRVSLVRIHDITAAESVAG